MPTTPMNGYPHKSARFRRALASLTALLTASSGFAVPETTTGYQNVYRPQPPGSLLSHPRENDSWEIGRTTTVNYLRGWLIVGPETPGSANNSDKRVRVYKIENPSRPLRLRPSDFDLSYPENQWNTLNAKGEFNYGWNAHGSAQTSDTLLRPPFTVLNGFGTTLAKASSTTYPVTGHRGGMAGPWFSRFQWYDTTDALFTLGKAYRNQNTGTYFEQEHGSFDHVAAYGGGDWHPIFFGDLLIYARSDSTSTSTVTGRAGIVVYRISYENFESSNLAQRIMRPIPVATLSTGFGAYWPNLFSDGARLYVVGGSQNRVQVADITDASDPNIQNPSVSLVVNYTTSLSNAPYPVYQDTFAFIHNKKFDMQSLIAGNANPIVLQLDENTRQSAPEAAPDAPAKEVHSFGVDTSQMSLPLGNLWLTGGHHSSTNNKSQGLGVWVQQQEPDTRKPTVAFHVPQRFRQNYPRFAPLSFLIHEVPRNGAVRPGIDFTLRPLVDGVPGAHVPGFAIHDMSGVLTYTPDQPLAANTTYRVDFLSNDNGTPNNPNDDIGFVDAAGNLMNAYDFTFSTGDLAAPTPPTITGVSAVNHQPAVGVATNVSVSIQGTAPHTYRFNFNGVWTDWSTSNTTPVSFSAPGRYRVTVQVKNDAGAIASSFVNILVPAGNALANTPTASGPMAIGQDTAGRRLWVVNPDSDTVSVLDAATGAKIPGGEYKVGKNPRTIARDQNGRYWVTLMGEDKIVILNQDGTVFQTLGGETTNPKIAYGAAPFAVCPNHNGSVMFVSYYGSGRLARFAVPAGSGAVGAPTVSSDTTPLPTARAIAVRYDGTSTRVFVTRFISTENAGEVHEYNGSTLVRARTINLSFLSNMIDAGDAGAGVPNYLAGINITPDGKYAVVSAKKDNVRRGMLFSPPPGPNVVNPVGDLSPENTVRAMLAVINLTTNAEATGARLDFDNSDSPAGIAFSGRGDTAFIALQGNNRVVAIDSIELTASGGSALPTARIGTGLAPQGVLYDSTSKRLYVQNFMGRTVSVFDTTSFQNVNQPSFDILATTNTVTQELLPDLVLEGKRIFYNASDTAMSAEGYISCATCHVDGGHDGRVWDFTGRGEGLRRTTDLRGRGGMSHGNVHWTANFDEIEDFEHDIRNAFDGSGFLPLTDAAFTIAHPDPSSVKKIANGAEELNALAAYVSSLGVASVPRSPSRHSSGALTSAANGAPAGKDAVAGKLLFDGLGTPYLNCAICHAGKKFTDSTVAPINGVLLDNVGTLLAGTAPGYNGPSGSRLGATLTGIDTPTLLGLHASRTYLHHGFASTLDEVFSFVGGKTYEAEVATPLYVGTDRAPTIRVAGLSFLDQAAGGGGQFSGYYGGKGVTLIADLVAPHTAIRFNNVDGGSGGVATLRIRYQNNAASLAIKVNGTALSPDIALPASLNSVGTFSTSITLVAGTNNTIELRRLGADVTIDSIQVSNASDRALADTHHRRIFNADMDDTKRGNLLAYLRQIDGRDDLGKFDVFSGMVARYAFETSTLGADSAGSAVAKNGTVYGAGVTRTTDLRVTSGQGATSWNGNAANRIEVPDHDDLDGGSKFSISVRIKPDATGIDGSARGILSKRTGNGQQMAYGLFLFTDGKLHVDITGSTRFSTPLPMPTDTWTHVVLVFDGTQPLQADRVKLYIDGALTATVSNNRTTMAATTAPLHIGTMNANYGIAYSGLLDDIRLYKGVALTDEEVARIRDSSE